MAKWRNQNVQSLSFPDLALMEGFRIVGRQVVYQKVYDKPHQKFFMLEVETGALWEPTHGAVERVKVEVYVDADKPVDYRR